MTCSLESRFKNKTLARTTIVGSETLAIGSQAGYKPRMTRRPPATLTNWPIFSLKGGLAAGLALLLCQAFKVNDPISATFVAVMCITPTLVTGLRAAVEQALGSLIGGAIATLLVLAGLPPVPALILSVGLAILASGALRMPGAHGIAAFTALYVVLMPAHVPTYFYRMGAVAIAAGAALGVNFVLSAVQYRQLFGRRMAIVRQAVAWTLQQTTESEFGYGFAIVDGFTSEVEDARRETWARRRLGEKLEAYRHEAILLRHVLHFGLDAIIRAQASAATELNAASRTLQGEQEPMTLDTPLAAATRAWAEHVVAHEGHLPRASETAVSGWDLWG